MSAINSKTGSTLTEDSTNEEIVNVINNIEIGKSNIILHTRIYVSVMNASVVTSQNSFDIDYTIDLINNTVSYTVSNFKSGGNYGDGYAFMSYGSSNDGSTYIK